MTADGSTARSRWPTSSDSDNLCPMAVDTERNRADAAKIDRSWYFAERNLILDWSETRLLGTDEES